MRRTPLVIGKRTVHVPAREIQASLQSSRTRRACSDCSDINSRDSESLEKLEGFVILHALHRKRYRVVRFLLAVVQRLLMLTKPAHKAHTSHECSCGCETTLRRGRNHSHSKTCDEQERWSYSITRLENQSRPFIMLKHTTEDTVGQVANYNIGFETIGNSEG